MSTKKVPDPVPPSQADPFADLGKLRLSQDFAATVGVKKLLTTVPVRKPTGQDSSACIPTKRIGCKRPSWS